MISTPVLLLDEGKCRNNISGMVEKAVANNVTFRPHFKTHVSAEIGGWFWEAGVNKITVSSLRMAEYFAASGWKDILVAFPFNIREIELANKLADTIRLSLLVESAEVAEFLSKNLRKECEIYLKIDTGLNRTGILYSDTIKVAELIKRTDNLPNLKLTGLLTHAGHSYGARSHDRIIAIHKETTGAMLSLRENLGLSTRLLISVGDTPTCSVADDFSMVDEIRPGNFVFYDFTQVVIGSCSISDVAVAMACPVVAVHPERNTVIVYGGAIHFSRESVRLPDGRTVYGIVTCNNEKCHGEAFNEAYLTGMSQEHGIVTVPASMASYYKPGDIMTIIPAHSCITAHVMGEYLTCSGRVISRMR
jgi:D-serine deaminase-like pyridoxal phosphate-dependent protein